MSQIHFDREPDLGTIVMLDDQAYELVAAEDHRRKDGSPTTLLRWSTHCPVCGDHFEVMSGLSCKTFNRRCEAHRTAGKPIRGKRSRKIKVEVIEP